MTLTRAPEGSASTVTSVVQWLQPGVEDSALEVKLLAFLDDAPSLWRRTIHDVHTLLVGRGVAQDEFDGWRSAARPPKGWLHTWLAARPALFYVHTFQGERFVTRQDRMAAPRVVHFAPGPQRPAAAGLRPLTGMLEAGRRRRSRSRSPPRGLVRAESLSRSRSRTRSPPPARGRAIPPRPRALSSRPRCRNIEIRSSKEPRRTEGQRALPDAPRTRDGKLLWEPPRQDREPGERRASPGPRRRSRSRSRDRTEAAQRIAAEIVASGYRGLTEHGGRVRVAVCVGDRHEFVGLVDSVRAGASAHDKRARELKMPESCMNFPRAGTPPPQPLPPVGSLFPVNPVTRLKGVNAKLGQFSALLRWQSVPHDCGLFATAEEAAAAFDAKARELGIDEAELNYPRTASGAAAADAPPTSDGIARAAAAAAASRLLHAGGGKPRRLKCADGEELVAPMESGFFGVKREESEKYAMVFRVYFIAEKMERSFPPVYLTPAAAARAFDTKARERGVREEDLNFPGEIEEAKALQPNQGVTPKAKLKAKARTGAGASPGLIKPAGVSKPTPKPAVKVEQPAQPVGPPMLSAIVADPRHGFYRGVWKHSTSSYGARNVYTFKFGKGGLSASVEEAAKAFDAAARAAGVPEEVLNFPHQGARNAADVAAAEAAAALVAEASAAAAAASASAQKEREKARAEAAAAAAAARARAGAASPAGAPAPARKSAHVAAAAAPPRPALAELYPVNPSTGFRGVTREGASYRARLIGGDGQLFDTAIEAARFFDAQARLLLIEERELNFPVGLEPEAPAAQAEAPVAAPAAPARAAAVAPAAPAPAPVALPPPPPPMPPGAKKSYKGVKELKSGRFRTAAWRLNVQTGESFLVRLGDYDTAEEAARTFDAYVRLCEAPESATKFPRAEAAAPPPSTAATVDPRAHPAASASQGPPPAIAVEGEQASVSMLTEVESQLRIRLLAIESNIADERLALRMAEQAAQRAEMAAEDSDDSEDEAEEGES